MSFLSRVEKTNADEIQRQADVIVGEILIEAADAPNLLFLYASIGAIRRVRLLSDKASRASGGPSPKPDHPPEGAGPTGGGPPG